MGWAGLVTGPLAPCVVPVNPSQASLAHPRQLLPQACERTSGDQHLLVADLAPIGDTSRACAASVSCSNLTSGATRKPTGSQDLVA